VKPITGVNKKHREKVFRKPSLLSSPHTSEMPRELITSKGNKSIYIVSISEI
jgi:hypothetical protein